MQLNTDQARVVESDGHCLVVAGPGSGKTRVITTKIGALLKRNPTWRIVAVTFTKASARELSHRVSLEIGEALFHQRCRINTFHSLAIRLLRNNRKPANIAGPGQQNQYLRRAMALVDPEMTWEVATSILEKAKGSLDPVPEQDHPLHREYAKLLQRAAVIDLYDVMRLSVQWMREGQIQPFPCQYMLVDEFQDTDAMQLMWVLEHAKRGTGVMVVGDDDQSIYSFRGSLGYAGMTQFRDTVGAEQITLGVNYRCRAEILAAADALVRNNSARITKELLAAKGPGGLINSIRCSDRDDEAARVAQAVMQTAKPQKTALFNYHVPAGSWAVLARGNRVLDRVELVLQDKGIEYWRPSGESIWSRSPFVHMLGLLASIQTDASAGVEGALNHGLTARIGAKDAHTLIGQLHGAVGDDLGRLLTEHFDIDYESMMPEAAKVVREFIQRAQAWKRAVLDGKIKLAIRGVADWFASFERGADDQKLVLRLGETICRLNGSLNQRVQTLSTKKESDEIPNGVALHTMHGSKGLEFDNVWIIATECTSIPSQKSLDYEEERRLMYVAMTRAKEVLHLSSVVPDEPSPFVIEAGCNPRQTLVT